MTVPPPEHIESDTDPADNGALPRSVAIMATARPAFALLAIAAAGWFLVSKRRASAGVDEEQQEDQGDEEVDQ